ncbi:hypothetical protein Tco_0877291 [Tanacetum coccineum]|uniref:Retrovirus-related Pol polyprotein from transposon TNT 1-94 n=1 Tax=Tanacetum coccineum TaxID=301880 RepID=A0ABQ5BUP0_9ASTR
MDSIIPLGQKNTLAEYMILFGADNRPPMLDKDLTKKYAELSGTEKIQADCDMKATNIILHCLPVDIYSLVNHHRVAKGLWERVQLLMQSISLTKQEREYKLYDAFDKFAHIKGESLHNKFVIDVKLVKDLHTTNYDQLHAYLEQHELHANEACPQPPSVPQIEYTASTVNQQIHLAKFPQIDSGLAVPGRPNSYAVGTSGTRANTSGTGGNYSGQQRVVKDKVLLVKAQGNGKALNEEELEFLADPGIVEGPVIQLVITYNVAYQADDLDAYDSDCNEISTAKAVLIANLSSYGLDVLFKEKEAKNIDSEIALEKKVKELDNIVQKTGQSAQTVHMITKPQVFYDNNLKQALGFQNPFYLKKSQQIRPMIYDRSVIAKETNVILIDDSEETLMLEEERRSKMFLKQKLSDEQAFQLQTLHPNTDQSASSLVKIEAPRELPKITPDALTEGEWGFEHTKAIFLKEIIPFVKTLKDIFNVFNKDLLNETFKKILELEQHYISLEIAMQLNKEIFQKNNISMNQTEPSFDQLFELNNLIDELQAKDTIIKKMKAHIKCVNETSTSESVKKDFDEIETINIELEHGVTKLIAENEHLKQTYKQLYDSIKPSRVRAKEQIESLVNQVNQKSVEISGLNAQL